jgi:peptide deformylase
MNRVLVAHTYNPSYSAGRDQEDCCLNQPGQIVHETISKNKKKIMKKMVGAGRMAQGVGPEFKPQY